MQDAVSHSQPSEVGLSVREGQMWKGGLLGCRYHVLALYGDHVWTLLHYPEVSAARQPTEPKSYTRSFYEQEGMVLVYDPTRQDKS